MIRLQGSNQTHRMDTVRAHEEIVIQGSNASLKVKGDVLGKVTVQGSNPEVTIGGRIRAGARVVVQGSNATLKHHGRDRGARVVVQGSNAEECDLGGHDGPREAPPDISWLEFSSGVFGRAKGYADVTPEAKSDRHTVSVQKSNRPREKWGT